MKRTSITLCISAAYMFLLTCPVVRNWAIGQSTEIQSVAADLGSLPPAKFVNPIGEGADPWVVWDEENERYLWCLSEGNRAISIWKSKSLSSLGSKQVVWTAPDSGLYSREVWAPELHQIDGRWYIYFAASDGKNENHKTFVLESEDSDPFGKYRLHGPLRTGDGEDRDSPNVWAIDMTVLEHDQQRFAIWSGWDAPGTDQQFLYIAKMKSPFELEGKRVQICSNEDFLWERIQPDLNKRGLNEGPQILKHAGRTFVLFSCGASWMDTYKLGMLELVGTNPLATEAWKKHDEPVFQRAENVYGVGHSCFVPSPDKQELWHVYHAKRDKRPGWRRAIYIQPIRFSESGWPQFAPPEGGVAIERPSGETSTELELPLELFAKNSAPDATWSYFGHHQYVAEANHTLELGRIPDAPINEYRCGEKVVLDGFLRGNYRAKIDIDFHGDTQSRDAGILFRCSGASV
ncbi:MAG: glycoside hydrolase family 43 protein, partial [Planctomycetota bacterium]